MKFLQSIPSRSTENFCFHVGDYSFGFNGKELDKEGMGGGASTYDYGFRIYNSALGRFLSVDPLSNSFAWLSPFHFAGNTPIWCIDLEGLEPSIATEQQYRVLNWNSVEAKYGAQSTVEFWKSGALEWGLGQNITRPTFGVRYFEDGPHRVEWFYCQSCEHFNSSSGLWYWRVKKSVDPIKLRTSVYQVPLDYEIKISTIRIPIPTRPGSLDEEEDPEPPGDEGETHVNIPGDLDFSANFEWVPYDATLTDAGWELLGSQIGTIQLLYWSNPDKFFMTIDMSVLRGDSTWEELDKKIDDKAPTIFAGKPRRDLIESRIASISNYMIRNGIPASKFKINPRIDQHSLGGRIRTTTK